MRSGQQKAAGDTAAELMTRPAVTVPATETVTGAARLMDAARVKRMPVVDDGGRLIGIVSRRDLVRMYTRPDAQLRASVAEGVLRSLWIDPAALHITVRAGIVTLSGRVDRRSLAGIVVQARINYPLKTGMPGTGKINLLQSTIYAKDCLLQYKRQGRVLAVASIYRDLASLKAELQMEQATV